MKPAWYGVSYPGTSDLQAFAASQGAAVTYADIPSSWFLPRVLGKVPVILLPRGLSLLEETWALAHELGHLVHGNKDDALANYWAARALLPLPPPRATMDSLTRALVDHYGPHPLAALIATIRLKTLEEVA